MSLSFYRLNGFSMGDSLQRGLSACQKTKCLSVIDQIEEYYISRYYVRPVDPEADNCPTYFSIIQNPMDLGTIRQKLTNGEYMSVIEFKRDLDLIWANSMKFNGKGSLLYLTAQHLSNISKKLTEHISDYPIIDWINRINYLRHEFDTQLAATPSGMPAPAVISAPVIEPTPKIVHKSRSSAKQKEQIFVQESDDDDDDDDAMTIMKNKRKRPAKPSNKSSRGSSSVSQRPAQHAVSTPQVIPKPPSPPIVIPTITFDEDPDQLPPFTEEELFQLTEDCNKLTTDEEILCAIKCITESEKDIQSINEIDIEVDKLSKRTHYSLRKVLDQLLYPH